MGVDPGKLTGVVIMDAEGETDFWMNVTLDQFSEFLNDNLAAEISVVICEEYVVGVRAAKLKGSKNEASQAIGILRVWAQNHEIPIVFQQASIKEVGEKWSKITPNGQSHYKTHWIDALNHVVYWLVRNHYMQPESGVRPARTGPAQPDLAPSEYPTDSQSSSGLGTVQHPSLLPSLPVADEQSEQRGVLVQSPRDQPTEFGLERIPIRETGNPSSSYSVDGDLSQPRSLPDQD